MAKHRPRGGNEKGDFSATGEYAPVTHPSDLAKAKKKYPVKPPTGVKKTNADAPTDNYNFEILQKWFGKKKK